MVVYSCLDKQENEKKQRKHSFTRWNFLFESFLKNRVGKQKRMENN